MFGKRTLAVLLTVFSLTMAVFADAGPEPGYVRVPAPLVITPQDDFSAYRFFLNSPGGIEEIKLTKGKTNTISTEGRAGTMRFTMLLAIPVSSLSEYAAPVAPEKLAALKEAVNGNKIEGVIEVLSHDFDSYITKREKKTWKNPVYSLKASADKTIEAVETKPAGKKVSEVESEDGNSNLAMNITAGSFLSLSFIFGGVWFARRKLGAQAPGPQ